MSTPRRTVMLCMIPTYLSATYTLSLHDALPIFKTLEPEVFRDPQFGAVHRAQFQNEASLAGKLRHPHIVAILDAVVGEDSGHIAMEYVGGGDLSQHVKPGRLLSPADVLQIGFKCCGAMDYAYREGGIVHR